MKEKSNSGAESESGAIIDREGSIIPLERSGEVPREGFVYSVDKGLERIVSSASQLMVVTVKNLHKIILIN